MSIKAKKSLGQNFLHHQGTLHKIVESANLNKEDYVIEIGSGKGILTKALAEKAKHVTTIELDDRLIPLLKEQFKNENKITILHQDALTFSPPKNPYKIIANIPYYITSPLLNHFLKEQPPENRPTHITFLVQKEVAEKICTKPGKLNVLALQVQIFGKPKIIAKIPATHFHPSPKVESAILVIEIYSEPLIPEKDIATFFKIMYAGFCHKRKKLTNNLKSINGLTTEKIKGVFTELNLSENTRAQELTIEQWENLINLITR